MTADEAIRNLARSVAQATVELVAERLYVRGHIASALRVATPKDVADMLMLARQDIADEIADATMECAEDDPESEVHAVRRLRWPPASVDEALNSGDGSYRP